VRLTEKSGQRGSVCVYVRARVCDQCGDPSFLIFPAFMQRLFINVAIQHTLGTGDSPPVPNAEGGIYLLGDLKSSVHNTKITILEGEWE